MGIEMTTGMGDIDEYLEKQIENRIQALLMNLDHIGSTCVNEAKTGRTYTPRTQALLNSTGYAVIRDGVVVSGGGLKENGAAAGESSINALIAENPKGILLIVVAGMEYAARVEAYGYNVLTSAELLAEQLVPKIMEELGFKRN